MRLLQHTRQPLIAVLAGLFLFSIVTPASAATLYRWIGPVGGSWNSAANWFASGGAPFPGYPVSGDQANFQSGTSTVNVSSTQNVHAVHVVGADQTIALSGTLNSNDVYVYGSSSVPSMILDGGGVMNTTRIAFIGHGASSSSISGSATVNDATWNITQDLRIGNANRGFVSINNNGLADVTGDTEVGYNQLGTLNVNPGGTLTTANLTVSRGSGATNSSVRVTDGELNAGNALIGYTSAGRLTASGTSDIDLTSNLYVGYGSSSSGSRVDMSSSSGLQTVDVGATAIVGYNGQGTVNIGKQSQLTSVNGFVAYTGNSSGSSVNLTSDGKWIITKNLNVSPSGRTGSVTVGGSGARLDVKAATTIGSAGTINLQKGTFDQNGGTITNNGNFNFTGGRLEHLKTFNGDLVQQGGTLSAGPLGDVYATTINGNYDLQGGILEVEIRDNLGFGFDRYGIQGDATLLGDLNVLLLPSYTPTAGDSFTFLTASTITGGFNNISLPTLGGGLTMRLEIDGTSATLFVDGQSAVPEPSSWALFGLGLMGLVGYRRRSSRNRENS